MNLPYNCIPAPDNHKKGKSLPNETTHYQEETYVLENFLFGKLSYLITRQGLNFLFWKTFIFFEKFCCFILVNSEKVSTFVVVFREDLLQTNN